MVWWRGIHALHARARALLGIRRADEDLHDELSFHVAMQAEADRQRGLSDVDAARRARVQLGGLEQSKELARDVRPLRGVRDLTRDLRDAVRSLRRAPAFTFVAVLTLALGIGANTAMFSVLNAFLFRALPYQDAERLIRVHRTSIHSQSWPHSVANFLDFRERNDVFDQMAAHNRVTPSFVQEGQYAESLQGMAVTADFFPALGVTPALGRWFTAEEDQPGTGRVVVLSHPFWQQQFGGDPAIVGRAVQLDGERVEVIGVMPPGFEHPLLWGQVDLWRPIAFTAEQRENRGSNYLGAFARLKPGVTLAQAQDAMQTLAATLSEQTGSNQHESLRLEPLYLSMSDTVARQVMWFAFGLAVFVLAIACGNIANLQLVRVAVRAREHTVRAALGASRLRLLRHSLVESLVLAGLGGAASLLVATGLVSLIEQRMAASLPGAAVPLDFRVFAFALVCAVVTGVGFGAIPAWLASRARVSDALKDGARGSTTAAQHRMRHTLIAGEIAFALVLLVGAGLFLRGLERFSDRDPGWQVDGLLTAQLPLQGADYATPGQRRVVFAQLEERLRALPDVRRVALSTSPPPVWGFNSSGDIVIEGRPEPEPGQRPEAFLEQVSLEYFDTLGIRLLAGRQFTDRDTADAPQVVIINDAMARRFWPGESAIGKRINRPAVQPPFGSLEVVGVVNDVTFPGSLGEPYTYLQAFRPLAQVPVGSVNITVRSPLAAEPLAAELRRAVAEIDPTLPLNRVRSARSLVQNGLGSMTLIGTLLGAFALLGLALAVIGIYGVISYAVTQRANEFGIRMALGAQARDVLWLVMSKGARLIAGGTLFGCGGAYALSRLLNAAIPTLPTHDPLAIAGMTALLVMVALAACYLPAARATRLEPFAVLRHE